MLEMTRSSGHWTSSVPTSAPIAHGRLARGDIHVWFAFADRIVDGERLRRYEGVMSADERARSSTFSTARERSRYVVSRALVRAVLSQYHPTAPSSWILRRTPFGRPEVEWPTTEPALRFNLSESGGVAVCAVCIEDDVGIDIEHLPSTIEVARNVLSTAEVAALEACAPPDRHVRFCELWTLKESYLKARGVGLRLRPDEVRITMDEPSSITVHCESFREDMRSWSFVSFDLESEYRVALAVGQGSPTPLRIVARSMVPLDRDEAVDPVLRACAWGVARGAAT